MVSRVVAALCAAAVSPLVVAACSYTKADDAPVPAPGTRVVVPTASASTVVGTLPPITTAPTTALATVPAVTTATTAPAATPAPTNPPTAAPPRSTAPPNTAAPAAGPVTVQAGAYSTRDAASAAVAALSAKGFGGFGVSGEGPFRVVRGGLSGGDANALVRALAAAGVSAFVRA